MPKLLHNAAAAAIWTAARLRPIRENMVVFSSYYGRAVSDSPAAISELLHKKCPEADIVWLLKDPDGIELPEGVRAVDIDSKARITTLMQAKVWVDNCRKGARFKRSGQYYLQTWHGFALKRIEKDAADALPPEYPEYAKRDSRQCDLIVSNSRFMTDIYRNSFWYDGEIAEFGSPRNDVFFRDEPSLRQKVFDALKLESDRHLVLYAPTFRADKSTDVYRLDPEKLLSACEKRFGGEWSLLVRLHPNVDDRSDGLFSYDGKRILNTTHYPDMAELMYAADMLITDYSSCMFDFALSGRPVFQFATDIEAYKNDRNFNLPLDALPFSLCESNDALSAAVECFDAARYKERWEGFTEKNGIVEDGKASERCADWIIDKLNIGGKTE